MKFKNFLWWFSFVKPFRALLLGIRLASAVWQATNEFNRQKQQFEEDNEKE